MQNNIQYFGKITTSSMNTIKKQKETDYSHNQVILHKNLFCLISSIFFLFFQAYYNFLKEIYRLNSSNKKEEEENIVEEDKNEINHK